LLIDLIASLMLWAALLWATASGLAPRLGRWGWWIASLFLLAWLGLAGHPGPALALAVGATVAQAIDRRAPSLSPDFTGLLRSVMAVGLGYAAAGFVLVRLLHAEFALAFRSFPALATATVAVAVLVLAEGDREQLRVGRLLAVLATLAWVAAGPIELAPLAYVAAAWLPLLAGAARLRGTVEA
jgi:hypothetical protein